MCALQRRVGFAPRIRPFRLRPDGVTARAPVAVGPPQASAQGATL
jgi:hypothetical protein